MPYQPDWSLGLTPRYEVMLGTGNADFERGSRYGIQAAYFFGR